MKREFLFDPAIYRARNLDLATLGTDADLHGHFRQFGHAEPRLFGPTTTTAEYFSMKWLRGHGMEVGAGRFPTPLFGSAEAEYTETDNGDVFGTANVTRHFAIDGTLPPDLAGRFDFVIASHVLEHADSLLRAVENLVALCRPGGLIYLVVPDIHFLDDAQWMPCFDLAHHIEEYENPASHSTLHDSLVLNYRRGLGAQAGAHAMHEGTPQLGIDGVASLATEDLTPFLSPGNAGGIRFMLHKHTYDPNGWIGLFVDAQRFLAARNSGFTIAETGYGMERCDCHFMLRVC